MALDSSQVALRQRGIESPLRAQRLRPGRPGTWRTGSSTVFGKASLVLRDADPIGLGSGGRPRSRCFAGRFVHLTRSTVFVAEGTEPSAGSDGSTSGGAPAMFHVEHFRRPLPKQRRGGTPPRPSGGSAHMGPKVGRLPLELRPVEVSGGGADPPGSAPRESARELRSCRVARRTRSAGSLDPGPDRRRSLPRTPEPGPGTSTGIRGDTGSRGRATRPGPMGTSQRGRHGSRRGFIPGGRRAAPRVTQDGKG